MRADSWRTAAEALARGASGSARPAAILCAISLVDAGDVVALLADLAAQQCVLLRSAGPSTPARR
jgi:hypothetical protein